MRKFFALYSILAFIVVVFQILSSNADAISIATGSKVGTYYQFGRDIAKVAKEEGLDVIVKTSGGSFDNIKLMERKPYFRLTQFTP